MRVVVFGAGGCVGGWISEVLSQRNDVDLVACVRKWASAVRLARRGVDIRRADLENADMLPAILTSADVVVNAAMPPPAREPELATALYSACNSAGVRRFIQFSSAAIYGHRTGEVDETVTPEPVDDYSRAKTEMERRLVEAAVKSDTQLIVLRPSIIYGPFSEAWTIRYVERIAKGRWRGLGRLGDGTCNLVHAHDVANSVIAAATAEIEPGVHVLNINGPEIVSWNEYIEKLGDALGMSDRVIPHVAPFRGMVLAAAILRMGGKLKSVRSLYRRSAGTARAAMYEALGVTKLYPTLSELNLLGRKAHYSPVLAKRVLGCCPSIPLEQGLQQSVAWCRIHGVV